MARSLNGTSDRITLANEANFDRDQADPFSLAMWLNPSSIAGVQCPVSKFDQNPFTGWMVRMGSGTPGDINLQHCNSFGNRLSVFTPVQVIFVGVWTHVAITYDGSKTPGGVVVYVNGVSIALSTDSNTLTATTLNDQPATLGANFQASIGYVEFYAGAMAGFGFWNVALNAGNVVRLAEGDDPLSVRNASQVASLPLCGDKSPEPDKKGTNNGTLTGTTSAGGPKLFLGCPSTLYTSSLFPKIARVQRPKLITA